MSEKPIMKARLMQSAGREQLRIARRRYGKFLWNALVRCKTINEKNGLMEHCGRRAIERGLYSVGYGKGCAASALLKWAIYGYCAKAGMSWSDSYKAWWKFLRGNGLCQTHGQFTHLKVVGEDAA